MLRTRSKKLLSGVSAIAVVAGVGILSPAMAAPVYSGPATFPPIINDQTSFVVINADATVDKNPGTNPSNTAPNTAGDSFYNSLTMTGPLIKLRVSDSFLLGDIENTGTMQSSTGNAILIHNDSQIGGRIFNADTGLIQGGIFFGAGIVVTQDSTVAGGIVNNGTILSGFLADGITVGNDSEVFGGIYNSGLISGQGDGIDFNDEDVDFSGGIINTSTGTIQSTNQFGLPFDAAIEWGGNSFTGGIDNQGGTVLGVGNADGFHMQSGVFAGGITNTGLFAGNNGIRITEGTFSEGIINNAGGTIQGNGGTAAIWFEGKAGATFTGGILNNDLIHGMNGANGIRMDAGTFNGGIINNSTGTIRGDGSAAAILIGGSAVFNGGISNSGVIDNTLGGIAAIHITGASFFNDGITNNSTGVIDGANNGIFWDSSNPFNGGITNNGDVIARGNNGIWLSGAFFNGGITNNGTINAVANGIFVDGGVVFTGNIINNGLIDPANGITIASSVSGVVANNFPGTIEATNNGIWLTGGGIAGLGITNSGRITAQSVGINLDGEGDATEITQTGGLIRGNTAFDGSGDIRTALLLDQNDDEEQDEFLDTFTGIAGRLDGDVIGGEGSGDSMFFEPDIGDTFAYVRGTASGLTNFSMSGSGGDFIMGANFRGDPDGEGILVDTAKRMVFDGTGRVYVDDDTEVNLDKLYRQTGPGTILEYLLTADEDVHGRINSFGADEEDQGVELGGRIAAYIDGTSIADAGGDDFYYADVITGLTKGTDFDDDDVISNRLFFQGKALVFDDHVDIALQRRFFGGGVLGFLSHNESEVANVLDDIYDLGPGGFGGYGEDMQQVFEYLFNLAPGEGRNAIFVLNELAGAEHAQLQHTTQDILNPFNMFIGQRMDDAKASQTGVSYALMPRYAMASAIMTDANQGLIRGPSGMSVWARGYGQTLDAEGDREAAGYDEDTGGLAGGMDFAVGPNALAGGALGWSSTDVSFVTLGDDANIDTFQIGAYGSYGFGNYYAEGALSGAFFDVGTTRLINLPLEAGGPTIATASYDADSFTASGEFGSIWHSENMLFQPNLTLTYSEVSTDGFVESGAGGLGLIVGDSNATSFASSLGGRLSALYRVEGSDVIPELMVAWRHEFDDERTSFIGAFPDALFSPINIISSAIDPDSALLGLGVTAGVSANVEIYLNYNGLYNADVEAHNGSVGLRATW